MFPPSDSHSQENSSDVYPESTGGSNGTTGNAATVDDRRGHDLVPFNGGMMAPGGMPWSFTPMRPEILTATPTFTNLMHALRRRLWLAIFAGLVLGGGLGYAAWRLMPTKYESYAVLQVKIQSPSVWAHPESNVDFQTYKLNAMSALKSDSVINQVLDDRTVQDAPAIKEHGIDASAWLSDNITPKSDPESEYIKVGLQYDDARGLPDIVNALVNAYLVNVVEKERTETILRRELLEKAVAKYKEKILDNSRHLYEMRQQNNATDVESAATQVRIEDGALQALIASKWEAKRDLEDVAMKISVAKATAEKAQQGILSDQQLDDIYSRDPQITGAQHDLETLQREEREIKNLVKNPRNAPEMIHIRDLIRSLNEQIEEYKHSDQARLIDSLKHDADMNGVSQKALETQAAFYQQQLKQADERIVEQAKRVQSLVKFNGDADALQAEITELKTLVEQMNQSLDQWNIELNAPSRVVKLGDASAVRAVDPYKQYGMAAFGGLLGFGLALAGATFYEFFSRRLNSATDVAEGLGIRVMGDLPALRRRRIALRARSRKAIHGLVAESINSIRAALIRNAEPGACNVYLVSSAVEQEGKTTVASQLAASLARSGRRTLLVDCDLRHPGAHHVFGLTNEYGFSELLRGEVHVDDAIRPTPADNLWMITAGRCCAQAVLMLGKDALGEIFSQLESRFDFIVVDAGPVLKVADPMLLGQFVDGAILSVLRDVSQIHKVYEASERLKLAGVKVVGAVVNGVDEHGAFDRYNIELPAA